MPQRRIWLRRQALLGITAGALLVCTSRIEHAQSACDHGWVVEEEPQSFESELCAGGNPFDAVMTFKGAAIAAEVICQAENWKTIPIDLTTWGVSGWSECEQAPQGGTPSCVATFEPAFYVGVISSKHVFRRSIHSAHAESDGTGCEWLTSDIVVEEHKDWPAPGCCAAGCQDPVACESETSLDRTYLESSCLCVVCDEREDCVSPPPCTPEQVYDEACDCCKTPPEGSPIILDIKDNGIEFSAPSEGIMFDLFGDGKMWRVSWPISPGAYWLALDRNGNGVIDSGAELFGNVTRRIDGTLAPHGYAALSDFDDNDDDRIDARDVVFSRLRLWRRQVPTERSQPADELHSLPSLGLAFVDLKVEEIGKIDRWGTVFAIGRKRASTEARRGGHMMCFSAYKLLQQGRRQCRRAVVRVHSWILSSATG